MKYMLLIYADESGPQPPEAEQQAFMQRYFEFTEELQKAGKMVAGDPLEGTSTATSVRVRDRKTMTTDGPFAETKEQLGGYYIVDADNLDEAIQWAAKVPTATYGSIEVRPIWEMES